MVEEPDTTISEALRVSAAVLAEAGIANPRAEAGWLLAEVLAVSRAWLLAHPESAIARDKFGAFDRLVARRAAREPFAYVVGHREFYGLEMDTPPAVLIPRPETELLVDEALRSCERLRKTKGRDLVVVDVGTGSGAIAIALAAHQAGIRVLAVDASAIALDVARGNAIRHSVIDRVVFRHSDLLEAVDDPIDLLVANLPYVPSGDFDGLEPEVSKYEPRAALDGGLEGTDLIHRLLVQASGRMTLPAEMIFEIGEGQGQGLVDWTASVYPMAVVRVERDYAGLERLLIVELPEDQPRSEG